MFNKSLPTFIPPFTYKHVTLPLPFLSLVELHKDTNKSSPKLFLEDTDHFVSAPYSPLFLHKSLVNTNYLFFIQHTPENTLKPRCFLVLVNHEETANLKIDALHTGNYHVNFLSRYPNTNHLCDNIIRWRLEWYVYQLDDQNISVYEARMLYSPKRKLIQTI